MTQHKAKYQTPKARPVADGLSTSGPVESAGMPDSDIMNQAGESPALGILPESHSMTRNIALLWQRGEQSESERLKRAALWLHNCGRDAGAYESILFAGPAIVLTFSSGQVVERELPAGWYLLHRFSGYYPLGAAFVTIEGKQDVG